MGKKSPVAARRFAAEMEDFSQERQQRIAHRAYELYVAKGSREGYDLEDWLEAERELADAA